MTLTCNVGLLVFAACKTCDYCEVSISPTFLLVNDLIVLHHANIEKALRYTSPKYAKKS